MPATPWPAGWGARLSPTTRLVGTDRLVGGMPMRVMRLSALGVEALASLTAGTPRRGIAALCRALTDAGVASCVPVVPPASGWPSWSVVVPVRDRPAGLAATLAALAGAHDGAPPPVEVVVVDDGSVDPVAVDAATVLRRPLAGGPAAARNTGWRATSSDVVVFLDADCEPATGSLTTLLAHFADTGLAAVGPRVRSTPGSGALARYELSRSPLDLGPTAGPVRPSAAVSYLPTAALAVRRRALDDVGGFDEGLSTGEDVDLVWRLAAPERRVRYEPAAVVWHPPRSTLVALARQRFAYGRSAAPLAARHGGAVAPLRGGALPLGAVAGGLLAGPLRWAAGAAVAAAVATRTLHDAGLPLDASARIAASAQGHAVTAASLFLRRPWGPLLLVAGPVLPRRVRRRALALAVTPLVAEWATSGRHLDLPRWLALAVADDLGYAGGVLVGAARARSARSLVPSITWPPLPSLVARKR